jgi:hypothetical protein
LFIVIAPKELDVGSAGRERNVDDAGDGDWRCVEKSPSKDASVRMSREERGRICKSLYKPQNYREKERKKQTIVNKCGNTASDESPFKRMELVGKPMENGQNESAGEKKDNEKEEKPGSPYSIEFVFSILDDTEGNNKEEN